MFDACGKVRERARTRARTAMTSQSGLPTTFSFSARPRGGCRQKFTLATMLQLLIVEPRLRTGGRQRPAEISHLRTCSRTHLPDMSYDPVAAAVAGLRYDLEAFGRLSEYFVSPLHF